MQGRTGTTQDARPNPNTGHRNTPPPSNTATERTRRGANTNMRGTARSRREGHHHSTRPSPTMPPPPRHATPPSTMPPPTTTTRGEHTQDTPPHEHHRHTLTAHTPHTQQRDSTRHDNSTRHYCSGMDSTRLHHGPRWTNTAHTTAIQWSTRGGWTPSTHHHHSFTFTQPMNDHDQR